MTAQPEAAIPRETWITPFSRHGFAEDWTGPDADFPPEIWIPPFSPQVRREGA
jgi:hypothetical protein